MQYHRCSGGKLIVYADEHMSSSLYLKVLLMRGYWEPKPDLVGANLVLSLRPKSTEIYYYLNDDNQAFNHLPFGHLLCDPCYLYSTFKARYYNEVFYHFRVYYYAVKEFDRFQAHHEYLRNAVLMCGAKPNESNDVPRGITAKPVGSTPLQDIYNKYRQDEINNLIWGGTPEAGLNRTNHTRSTMSFEKLKQKLPNKSYYIERVKCNDSFDYSHQEEPPRHHLGDIREYRLPEPTTAEERVTKPDVNVKNSWIYCVFNPETYKVTQTIVGRDTELYRKSTQNPHAYFVKVLERSFIVPASRKEVVVSRFFVVTNEVKLYIYNRPLIRQQTPLTQMNEHEQMAELYLQRNPNFSTYRDKLFFTCAEAEQILWDNNVAYRAGTKIVEQIMAEQNEVLQKIVGLVGKYLINGVKCRNSFELYQADFVLGHALDKYQSRLLYIYACPPVDYRLSAFEFVLYPELLDDLYDITLDGTAMVRSNPMAYEFHERIRARNYANRDAHDAAVATAMAKYGAGNDLTAEEEELLRRETLDRSVEYERQVQRLAREERVFRNLRYLHREADLGRWENGFVLYKAIE